MNRLLKLSALIEASAGLGLIAAPALVVGLLLGTEIAVVIFPLARVAGVALLALGIACWLASFDDQSCAARGIVSGMVLYNFGTTLVLAIAGVQSQPIGILLWPAVLLHTVMGVWCIGTLLKRPIQITSEQPIPSSRVVE